MRDVEDGGKEGGEYGRGKRDWERCNIFPYRTSLHLPHAHDCCILTYGTHGVIVSQR
jgi:hypothetical protein